MGCDRKDFYHQFSVTPERVRTNVVGLERPAADFADFDSQPLDRLRTAATTAKKGAREEVGDRLGLEPPPGLDVTGEASARVQACFAAAPMGDHVMVDVVLDSHSHLLEHAGLLSPDLRILGKKAVPDVSRVEGLIIDDWFTVEKVPLHAEDDAAGSLRAYRAAQAAYARERLPGSTSKDYVGSKLASVGGGGDRLAARARSGWDRHRGGSPREASRPVGP
jgi:hypothetical protein